MTAMTMMTAQGPAFSREYPSVSTDRWQPMEELGHRRADILSSMRVPDTWETSEQAVHAFDGFCIDHRWPFVRVPGSHDFGKDGYVDVTQRGALTGELFAVQVKGGESYRAGGGGYRIPVDDHGYLWARSTVPVIGVVHDPSDDRLRWVNLTASLTEDPAQKSVWVDGEACLDRVDERDRMLASVRGTPTGGSAVLLALGSDDEGEQAEAIWTCFALARHDSRSLIALRCLFLRLGERAAKEAVIALSHCTPHPDILWTKHNWLPPPVQADVCGHMRWSVAEVQELLSLVDPDEGIARGTLGQCVYFVLVQDPDYRELVQRLLYAKPSPEVAWWALILHLYWAREPREEWLDVRQHLPWVNDLDMSAELHEGLREHGSLSLW